MDISRPDLARKKKLRQALYAVAAVMAVAAVTLGVSRLEPAAPRVDRDTLYLDTVQRGPMVRQVRGTGTLVPEQIRWIPATTDGTVERIVIRPGALVAPATVPTETGRGALCRAGSEHHVGRCGGGRVDAKPPRLLQYLDRSAAQRYTVLACGSKVGIPLARRRLAATPP